MEKRIRNGDKGRTYQCEFQLHSDGHFEIGGKLYRPIWPRGVPDDWEKNIAEEFVDRSIMGIRDFYDKTQEHPTKVRSLRFQDGSIELSVKKPDGKEILYYLTNNL
jgi:hypothetical protein